ncbi:hypothetical protein HHI36_015134 [Cryptolaemus montrouzieri]|uniref:Uncharacterized protein n=1 Tax=Cryptolaemus montrouzieri TaxID=559131 RepID=A0ABD2N544_9CUCU
MGSSMSSSSSDRRNNALRRSQRKSLTGACSGIDKILKVIKKFKGTEDSEEYKNLKIRIIQIEKNLQQKVGEIQPQFQAIHNITEQKIKTAYELLDQKAKENSDHANSKDVVMNGGTTKSPLPSPIENLTENEPPQPSPNPNHIEEPLPVNKNDSVSPVQSPTNENKRNSLLLRLSKLTSPKRESKSPEVQVTAEVHKSPEATRKSIMKYGVPVLPSPTTNGRPRLVSFNTPDEVDTALVRHEKRLKLIKQDVANLEIRISEFIGKRDGKHYNNLKDALTKLVEELEEIDEEELLDQVVMCHNYIKSCFNFLDSKVTDDIDDDIFTNYTDSKIYGSTHDLLEGSVRTTAI